MGDTRLARRLRGVLPRRTRGPAVVAFAGHTLHWQPAGGTATLKRLGPDQELVVALHGLGAGPSQIGTLIPLALDGAVLALRGGHPRRRDGWSWFPNPLPEGPADWDAAVARVVAFTRWARLRAGVDADRTTVLGYSQGAALAAAVGLRCPGLASRIVLASAALPPGMLTLGAGAPDRAFVVVGDDDPLVDDRTLGPVLDHWRRGGTEIAVRHHDIRHVVSPAAASDIARWITEHARPLA